MIKLSYCRQIEYITRPVTGAMSALSFLIPKLHSCSRWRFWELFVEIGVVPDRRVSSAPRKL